MKLPPMNALPVFETVARLESFSRAAEERNLSQSAVSHQIRQLENYLGEPLFERKGRTTRLTDQGKQFYESVYAALTAVERASEDIKGVPSTSVRLALFSSFAVRWLIPNLSTLTQEHPQVTLQLEMTSESPILSDRVGDCFVTLHNHIAGYEYIPLYSETLFAVCSRQYWHDLLQKQGRLNDQAPPLSVLDQATLLSTHSIFDQDREDWRQWYDANGGELPIDIRLQSFSHMLLALEAARHHQGVTLTNDYMVQDQRDTDLIRLPFKNYRTGDKFYFAFKSSRRNEEAILQLKQWMVRTCRRTGLQ